MESEMGARILAVAQPVYNIVLPPTPAAVQRSGLLDVAPAPGVEMALLGTIAAVVSIVLVLILRSRRK